PAPRWWTRRWSPTRASSPAASPMTCRRSAKRSSRSSPKAATRRAPDIARTDTRRLHMALVHSVLMAAIGGMRAVTPLAAVANAARDGLLPRDNGAPRWLSSRATSAATGALALAEMAGDKMKDAPDRIALPGLLARC